MPKASKHHSSQPPNPPHTTPHFTPHPHPTPQFHPPPPPEARRLVFAQLLREVPGTVQLPRGGLQLLRGLTRASASARGRALERRARESRKKRTVLATKVESLKFMNSESEQVCPFLRLDPPNTYIYIYIHIHIYIYIGFPLVSFNPVPSKTTRSHRHILSY